MKFRARTLTIGLLVLLLASGLARESRVDAHEGASDLPDVPAAAIGDDLTPAQLEDLATVASQRGWTLDEAITRAGWHESFAILADEIRQKYPDEFAGARIEATGNPWIGFRAEVPAGVEGMVSDFEREVFSSSSPDGRQWSGYRVVLSPQRGFSEAEIDERLIAAHQAAFGQVDLVAHASSGYDIETGVIIVDVEPIARLDLTPDALSTELRSRSAALRDVEIRVATWLYGGDDVAIYGGDLMSVGCTSGFTVRYGSGRGISTAQHCGNNASMSGVVLTFRTEHRGTWGDMQWHSSQNSNHFDDFWSGSTSAYAVNLRDVSGVGTPVAGQSLCKNGITSYKTCEDVYQLNHCKDGACHLVAMHRRHAAPGDSGGPWFWGNTAYGLHQGYKVYWFIERDLFTMAVNIPNGMPAVYVLVDG